MVRKKYCLLVLSLRAKRRFWAHATTTPSDDARRGDVQSRCTFPLCCTHTLRLKNTFYKIIASPLEPKLFVLTANATTTPSSIMLPWRTTQNTFWPQLQCCSHTHIPMPQVVWLLSTWQWWCPTHLLDASRDLQLQCCIYTPLLHPETKNTFYKFSIGGNFFIVVFIFEPRGEVGNFPMWGGSRLIVVEAATGFNVAPFTSRYKNTFYKFSYSFQGKNTFYFWSQSWLLFLFFSHWEDLGNFPMHTEVAQVSMLQLPHPETKNTFYNFSYSFWEEKYFYNWCHRSQCCSFRIQKLKKL